MNIFASFMINIGQKIKEVIEIRGMAKTELARRMNMTSSNVHKIFMRKTIDTGLLMRLSVLLEHNFFRYYSENESKKEMVHLQMSEPDENSHYYEKLKEKFTFEIEALSKEIKYLREINELLRERLNKPKSHER